MSKIILGGGLSGLSSGYYALSRFPNDVIMLLEASHRTGGWLRSTKIEGGGIFEQAARTIRPRGNQAAINTLRLLEDLGLGNQIIPIPTTSPAASNRMIYANGKLHVLPKSFSHLFVKQPPFSKSLIRFLLKDLFAPRKVVESNDESMYSFIERRFGNEIADYLISPLVSGICAGDAKEISVKFLLQSLFEKEQKYGGVLKGLLRDMFVKKERIKMAAPSQLHIRSMQEKWNVFSFREGMETLPKELARNIEGKVNVKLNSTICSVTLLNDGVEVCSENGEMFKGDHLICCISANALGKLLEKQHQALAEHLKSIKNTSVCAVNLKYNKRILKEEGFGFLVAPTEDTPVLGVVYDSCCFPNGDDTILTVMMGGYKFDRYFNRDTNESEITDVALTELRKILNVTDSPVSYKTNVLHNCIPQYKVGHQKTLSEINRYIKEKNLPLTLCGASYHGVGVNDVIWWTKQAVDSIGVDTND